MNILKAPPARFVKKDLDQSGGPCRFDSRRRVVLSGICVLHAQERSRTSSTSRASSVSSKFTSEEFGFAAKFTTSDVKEKTISPAMTSFVSYIDNGAYYSEVQVLTKDLSQDLVDNESRTA